MFVHLQARNHLTMAGQSDSGLHDSVELKYVLGRAQKTGYEDSMTPADSPLIIRNGRFVHVLFDN